MRDAYCGEDGYKNMEKLCELDNEIRFVSDVGVSEIDLGQLK
jgi:hypothetical protein